MSRNWKRYRLTLGLLAVLLLTFNGRVSEGRVGNCCQLTGLKVGMVLARSGGAETCAAQSSEGKLS